MDEIARSLISQIDVMLKATKGLAVQINKRFTPKQGRYLAFIYYYTKLNGRPPAEADMQRYFDVTPPSVHQMVVTLEAKGFIARAPGWHGPSDS